MSKEKLECHVRLLKEGDTSAFDYVYERTHRSVYFAALYVLHDKMLAEDAMQEAFVRAISVIGQYREGTNFTAWITTIGRSIALNSLKKRSREVATDFHESPDRYGSTEFEMPYIFDLAAKVLDEEEYEIVMLCQVAGMKRREVAEMMGMPIGTVTWKNNEALKKLKNKLQSEDGV